MDLAAPLLLSLRVSLLATAAAVIIGGAVAWALARHRFPGRSVVEAIVVLPLVLPPTVLGYYLLIAVGRSSPIGRAIEAVTGAPLVFTWPAAVLAAWIVSVPLVIEAGKAAFASVDKGLEQIARTLGRSPVAVFLTVTLPLARRGLIAGATLAFARSLGEFGVTLMVAGSIPGRTQTAPLAIYDAVQANDLVLAHTLSGIVSVVVVGGLVVLSRVGALAAER